MSERFEVTGQEAVDRLMTIESEADFEEVLSPAPGYVRFVFDDGAVVNVKVVQS